MSRQKQKGTSFEREVVRYARRRTGDDMIDRFALHGSSDIGDAGPLRSHGAAGAMEMKNYKGRPAPGQLDKWRSESLAERENGGWDFMMLVVHEPGCNAYDSAAPTFGRNRVHMTLGDLLVMAFGQRFEPTDDRAEAVYGTWVEMTLEQAFDVVCG